MGVVYGSKRGLKMPFRALYGQQWGDPRALINQTLSDLSRTSFFCRCVSLSITDILSHLNPRNLGAFTYAVQNCPHRQKVSWLVLFFWRSPPLSFEIKLYYSYLVKATVITVSSFVREGGYASTLVQTHNTQNGHFWNSEIFRPGVWMDW